MTHLALSSDGRRLASGDGQGRIWVWDLPEFRVLTPRVPRPHEGEIGALAFLADGRELALSFDLAPGERRVVEIR